MKLHLVKNISYISHPVVYLCNACDRDRDTVAGVDFVTLHI